VKYCPNCGSKLGAEYKFCQECGHSLTRGQTSESDTSPKEVQGKDAKDEPDSDECLHENAVNLGANEAYCNECSKYIDLETGRVAESAKPGAWSDCQHLSLEKDLRGPNGERVCAKCGLPVSKEHLADLQDMQKVANRKSPLVWILATFTVLLVISLAFSNHNNASNGDTASQSVNSGASNTSGSSSQSDLIKSTDMLDKFNSGLRTKFTKQSQLTNFPDINQNAEIYADPDVVLLNYPDADTATKDGGIVLADLGKLSEQTTYWTCSNVMVIYPSEVKPLIAHVFNNWCDMGSGDTIDNSNDGYKTGYSFYLHAPDVPTLVNAGESSTYGPDGNTRDYVRTFKWCAGLSTINSLIAANTNSVQSQNYYDSESAGCADAMMKRSL
jgi:zinc-ribbon domain